tara:strand:+ start:4151 stop:4513 length:363 start_codon:yes stop_codon:yes gene_type:complete
MSANPARGEASINIGGKLRTVRYRTNEIAKLEDLSGKGIVTLMAQDSVGLRLLRDAIFVGLLYENKKLTPAKVGRWLDDYEGELGDLMTSVFTAIASSIPGIQSYMDEDEDEGKSDGENS